MEIRRFGARPAAWRAAGTGRVCRNLVQNSVAPHVAAVGRTTISSTSTSPGRAADRLGVTRSAVSQTIRKLEAAIGVALERRTTRSASLTEAGDSLLAGAGIGFGMQQSFQPHLERGDLVPVLVEHLQRWRGHSN